MLYVGMIEDFGHPRMYISSVSVTGDSDRFYDEAIFVEFTHRGKRGDKIAQEAELGVLRNKLTNGGAQVTIES